MCKRHVCEGKIMIKILEVFGEPISNGGQESFVFNTIQHMNLRTMRVDALTPYYCDNQIYKTIIEKEGGKIVELNLPFLPGKSRFNILKPLDKFLKKEKYDVIHVHSGSISVLTEVALVARLHSVRKIIVHSHCASNHKTIKYKLIKLLSTPIIEYCATDFCACSKVAGEWKFSRRIVENKLRIIKNGIDLKKFAFDVATRNQYRKRLKISEDTFVVGHVGRFSNQKNHLFLIDIFAELIKQYNNCKLLLIGSGETQEEVKLKVKHMGLSDDVIFAGNVQNVNEYMQVMDVFVLPSLYEGLPIVGVEAQASGLPVVVSASVSEELKLTENVCYVQLGNPTAWVTEIIKYMNMERRNNQNVLTEKEYNIETTALLLQHMYEDRIVNG